MINSDLPTGSEPSDAAVQAAGRSALSGALVLAGISSVIVIGLWFAFYLFIFVPRAIVP
ncbi:MAG TPA: hypothetical protein VMU81_28710 [Acetobacteraceae bacterium]|jgi:hypothetical protein|nr:hypothetical protein [Acetobacteraceae bacterium]